MRPEGNLTEDGVKKAETRHLPKDEISAKDGIKQAETGHLPKEGTSAKDGAKEAETGHLPKEGISYMYILRCADGTLYTGWTNNLARRVEAHNRGKGAKYTYARRPVELVYAEGFSTKEEAMAREYAVKQLSRKEKLELVKKGNR